MWHIVTSEASDGFQYTDIFSEHPGEQFVDNFGLKHETVNTETFDLQLRAIACLLAGRRNSKAENIRRDVNYIPRSRKKATKIPI